MKKPHEKRTTLEAKLKRLPPEKLAQVEDFVDFIAERDDRRLTAAAASLSEASLARIWDNSGDAAYDKL